MAAVSAPVTAVQSTQLAAPVAAYVPAVQALHTASVFVPAAVPVRETAAAEPTAFWLPQTNGARHVSAVAGLGLPPVQTAAAASLPATFTLSAAQAETRESELVVQV